MIQTHSSPYKDRDFSQDYSILTSSNTYILNYYLSR